jgi:hypothetical protein
MQAYRQGIVYLDSAVAHTLRGAAIPPAELRDVLATGRRLDDALRQYLAERGAKTVPLRELTAAANGATRLRLAGEAIALMRAADDPDPEPCAGFTTARELVCEQAASLRDWYGAFADGLDPRHPGGVPAEPRTDGLVDDVMRALRHDFDAIPETRPGATEQLRRLFLTSLYLQDLRVFESRLALSRVAVPVPVAVSR